MCDNNENNEILVSDSINTNQSSGYPVVHIVYEIAGTIFSAIIVLLLVMSFVFRQVTVEGRSMNDTLTDGDRLLVSVLGYTPKTGDIVVITHGKYTDHDESLIKRVIAVEGQRLRINYETGDVSIDGVLLNEPYITGKTNRVVNSAQIPDVIPKGYVFVMGDNRQNSLDSRSASIDLVPVENIVGKALFRIYPLNSFGSIE